MPRIQTCSSRSKISQDCMRWSHRIEEGFWDFRFGIFKSKFLEQVFHVVWQDMFLLLVGIFCFCVFFSWQNWAIILPFNEVFFTASLVISLFFDFLGWPNFQTFFIPTPRSSLIALLHLYFEEIPLQCCRMFFVFFLTTKGVTWPLLILYLLLVSSFSPNLFSF